MSNNTKPKYVNAIFLKKNWEDPADPGNILIRVGIKKAEFLKEIQAIQEDPRGFINLTIGRQKQDPSKFSMWQDEWVRPEQAAKPEVGEVLAREAAATDTSDDLPF